MRSMTYSSLALLFVAASVGLAEESFVTIYEIDLKDRQIVISKPSGRGPAERTGADSTNGGRPIRGQRGRRGGAPGIGMRRTTLPVAATVKITSAQRERRTGEFRVGVELSGGLKNRVFREIRDGLPARIVIERDRVTQINVMTAETDINQSNTNPATGATVIAIRPKRPPQKK